MCILNVFKYTIHGVWDKVPVFKQPGLFRGSNVCFVSSREEAIELQLLAVKNSGKWPGF